MLKQEWRNLVLLALVTLLSFAVGWWSIRDHGITFWFDQSRDAHLVSQIISQRDFKLLGPSASGTNDTVYHGVLYYYFIAPLYAIGGGEPMVPALALLFMGCLGVFPLYYFVKSFTGANMAAWLAVLAYAFSVEVIQLSYWLSNPSLAVTPLIIFPGYALHVTK